MDFADAVARDQACGKKRVLVAGLSYRTNRFVGGRTGLEDFEVLRGRDMLRGEGEASPIKSLARAAEERGWQLIPVVYMRAMPGPVVADAVVDLFWAEFRAVADAEADQGIDGVFLVVHGAMVSESHNDVEGEVLRRIRGIEHLADAPICGVMDPRANFTEAMGRQSDGLVAHRENPPRDKTDAVGLAAVTLDGLMQTEERPATVWDHPPIMWAPSRTATDEGPMLALKERAQDMEAELPEVLAVNVLAGSPHADVPEVGVGFTAVTTGDMEMTRGALRELNVTASALREHGTPRLTTLGEAMGRLGYHREGPVLLVEPSDAVETGAAGDATRVLRALVESGVPDAGVVIDDPETVALLEGAGPGEVWGVEIGGKSGQVGSEPLPLEVGVVFRSDGRFVPERSPGCSAFLAPDGSVDMGPCVLVRHGGVLVLLTSRRTPPFDLGQWRSQGVEPEELFAIGAKAAVEHRPAYGPIAKASYVLDLPGPCAENLKRLPFENVSRPIYPLDEL